MIDTFPHFKPLKLEDRDEIEKVFRQFPPTSDFNFVSLWSWNTQNDTKISSLHGNLVIKQPDYITNAPTFSFLGKNKVSETIQTLLEHTTSKGHHPELKLILTDLIDAPTKEILKHLEFTRDPDNDDYMFDAKLLSELKGGKFYDQRYKINRFKRKFPNYTVAPLDLTSKKIKKQMMDLTHAWVENKGVDKKEVENDIIATEKHLDLAKHIDFISVGIFIKDKMIGYSTNESKHDLYGGAYFRKADTNFPGVYQILETETAKALSKHDVLHYNYEQDLGIENLRKAKKSWRPVSMIEKYKISHKN